jgi:hypothetical protein
MYFFTNKSMHDSVVLIIIFILVKNMMKVYFYKIIKKIQLKYQHNVNRGLI